MPVVATDGHSYELSAISDVFHVGNGLSPLTREPLKPLVVHNVSLRLRIASYEDEDAAALDAISAHLAGAAAAARAAEAAGAAEQAAAAVAGAATTGEGSQNGRDLVRTPDEAGSSSEQPAPLHPGSDPSSAVSLAALALVSERTREKRKQLH